MKFIWVNSIDKFKTLSKDWDEALIDSGNFNPFLLSEFIVSWWKFFGSNLTLNILIVYNGNKIRGGLPLYIKKGGINDGFARILFYIGGSAANYTEPFFTSSRGSFLGILNDSLGQCDGWDALYLPDVRGENCLLRDYFSAKNNKPFPCFINSDHFNWAIDLSQGEKKYIESLSKKMMRDLRAKRKHAMRDYGQLNLVRKQGEQEIGKYFEMYRQFSCQAFKNRDKHSTLENNQYADFFKDFLIYMDRQNRLCCHVLFAGKTILAISFAYKFGKGFNWVLTGFNYDCKYIRPGYLLIEELLKEVLAQNETYYNWYGYERFYKEQWCNLKEPLYRFFLIKQSLRGYTYKCVRAIENSLRRNHRLMRLFRKIKKTP